MAVTPLGILLAKGVAISVQGVKPFAIGVRLCNARGCIVPITFNPALRKAFMTGDKAAFQMVDGSSGKPFSINVSLAGFSAAQKRLQDLQPASN